MNKPKKVIVEMTAEYHSTKVYDEFDNVLYEELSVMESRGRSRQEVGGDYFDQPIGEKFPELGDELDGLAFGPFGVSGALHDIESDDLNF